MAALSVDGRPPHLAAGALEDRVRCYWLCVMCNRAVTAAARHRPQCAPHRHVLRSSIARDRAGGDIARALTVSPFLCRCTTTERKSAGTWCAPRARHKYVSICPNGGTSYTGQPVVDAIVLPARRSWPLIRTGREFYCSVPLKHSRHPSPRLPAWVAVPPPRLQSRNERTRGLLQCASAPCGDGIACSDYGGEHLSAANGRLLATHGRTARWYVPGVSSESDFWCHAIVTIAPLPPVASNGIIHAVDTVILPPLPREQRTETRGSSGIGRIQRYRTRAGDQAG